MRHGDVPAAKAQAGQGLEGQRQVRRLHRQRDVGAVDAVALEPMPMQRAARANGPPASPSRRPVVPYPSAASAPPPVHARRFPHPADATARFHSSARILRAVSRRVVCARQPVPARPPTCGEPHDRSRRSALPRFASTGSLSPGRSWASSSTRSARTREHATRHDWFFALALAVRDRLVDGWMATTRDRLRRRPQAGLLSQPGVPDRPPARPTRCAISASTTRRRRRWRDLGVDAEEVLKVEPDAALGNGGLGRLAACLLDSMATLGIAGSRLRHPLRAWPVQAGPRRRLAGRAARGLAGLRQPLGVRARRGGLPGPLLRPGARGARRRRRGGIRVWEGGQRVLAVAYDTPVVGWGGRHINTLRLWSAQSGNLIDLEAFNRGDYMRAVQEQIAVARASAASSTRTTPPRPARSCA